MLAAAGVKFPSGYIAFTEDEAVAMARKMGFPVALKAREAKLARKTKAFPMLLNIADDAAVREAFQQLSQDVKQDNSSIELNGVLIESMFKQGVEIRIGGKRDPMWGPVIVTDLGGVLTKVAFDILLAPPYLSTKVIAEKLGNLKMVKMLQGITGEPVFDVKLSRRSQQQSGKSWEQDLKSSQSTSSCLSLTPPAKAPPHSPRQLQPRNNEALIVDSRRIQFRMPREPSQATRND